MLWALLPSPLSSLTCSATSRFDAPAFHDHIIADQPLTSPSSIQKIRDRQLAAPAESENIQDLCRNEIKSKKHIATEGLLWLIRSVPPFISSLSLSQH
jgi:hypothetical protein